MNYTQSHTDKTKLFLPKKTNRRRSFRIYDDVDIFYQKLDKPDLSNANQISDPQALPESIGAENATLNVNISNSGISFTCQETLQPGDIILVRVLLLSSMTMVMSYCKVVYCKPSNPYEHNRYPYTIGAEFVNLRPEDKALLNKHIQKKRKWQWFFTGLFLTALLTLIYVPELIGELLIELFEWLSEIFLEAVFLMDELINYWFSFLLSFLFPQSPHTVQTIGFYLQTTLYALIAIWAFFKWVPQWAKNTKQRICRFFSRKKASLGYFWKQLPLLHKIAYIFMTLAIFLLPGMFLI
jgi:hypothetical protein